MPSFVVEAECLAAVLIGRGNELALLKFDGGTITTNLQSAQCSLVRGRFYRVTIEEIEEPTQC